VPGAVARIGTTREQFRRRPLATVPSAMMQAPVSVATSMTQAGSKRSA